MGPCYHDPKEVDSGRRPILLHLSGFPCHTIGVWSGRNLPPQSPLSLYANEMGPCYHDPKEVDSGRRRISCISRVSPVIPSACGRNEIYHLKVQYLSTQIIAQLFFPVKNFFVAHIVFPPLLTNIPSRNNGIFEIFRIGRCMYTQHNLKANFMLFDHF